MFIQGDAMKFRKTMMLGLLLFVAGAFGCQKQESKLVGTWNSVKTPSSIKFNADKTGEIMQKTNPNLPPLIPFQWTLVKGNDFQVQVTMNGKKGPEAHGTINDDGTIVLDTDTFKKAP
jgi:hypothetical protein